MARVFKPALLSIIGTSGIFALALLFLTTSSNTSSGGENSALGAAIGFGIGLAIGGLGVLILAFAIVFLADTAHHRMWGAIVAFLYSLGYIPFLILLGLAESSNLLLSFVGIAGSTMYALGFVGGMWGLFFGTHLTASGIGKGIVGPTGYVFLGGLVSFVALALFGASVFLLPAFVLVLGPVLVYWVPRRRMIIGAVLLVASLATVLPVTVFLVSLTLHNLANNYSNIPSFLAIILGGVLAGYGAIQMIRRESITPLNVNPKPA